MIKHSHNVPPFLRYCSATIPAIFDDSMSYYEALCTLWKWLQTEVVDTINANATETEKYIQLTNDLKEFVENYFNNLDVQEEINNKLDAMVEDGTLEEIINQQIFGDLNNRIDEVEQNAVQIDNNEDATSINSKFKNISIDTDYYKNTQIYITKIKNIEQIQVVPTNGNPINPKTNIKNILDYSKTSDADIVINGGAFNVDTFDPIGYCIFNGVQYTPADLGRSYIYYGGFDVNNNLIIKKASEVSSIQDLFNLGMVNCLGSFTALYKNGSPIIQTENIKYPQQVIAQLQDGSYMLITSRGRSMYNDGITYTEMVEYLASYPIVNAFSLDGGGSQQIFYNKKSIINPSSNTTPDGRNVPTAITIKLGE